jgi:hypothetical protein
MRSLAWLSLLGICSSISCGARSSLRDLVASEEGASSGGGGNGPGSTTATTTSTVGTGGEGGGAPPPECPTVELTDYALSELVLDGRSIHSVEMSKAAGFPTMVCAAGELQEQAPTTPYGAICFDAFGRWPSVLDQPTPLVGSTYGEIRIAPGVPDGIAVFTGSAGDFFPVTLGYTQSWTPGAAPDWTQLSSDISFNPAFLASAGDKHIAGIVGDPFQPADMTIAFLDSSLTPLVGAACAQGSIAADGLYHDNGVIVAASGGASIGGCLVEPITEARRLQVAWWPFMGSPTQFLDQDLSQTIEDVDIADAGSSVWVAARAGGEVYVTRLGKTGSVEVPLTFVATTIGAMSIAMRGEELLVATIDWTDPDLAADIVVHRVSPDGATGAFGGFDTNEATWVSDLAIEVSDDHLHAVVAYHAGPGQLAARRFDCVGE